MPSMTYYCRVREHLQAYSKRDGRWGFPSWICAVRCHLFLGLEEDNLQGLLSYTVFQVCIVAGVAVILVVVVVVVVVILVSVVLVVVLVVVVA